MSRALPSGDALQPAGAATRGGGEPASLAEQGIINVTVVPFGIRYELNDVKVFAFPRDMLVTKVVDTICTATGLAGGPEAYKLVLADDVVRSQLAAQAHLALKAVGDDDNVVDVTTLASLAALMEADADRVEEMTWGGLEALMEAPEAATIYDLASIMMGAFSHAPIVSLQPVLV